VTAEAKIIDSITNKCRQCK